VVRSAASPSLAAALPGDAELRSESNRSACVNMLVVLVGIVDPKDYTELPVPDRFAHQAGTSPSSSILVVTSVNCSDSW